MQILVVIAFLEVAIDRIAVPMLRPAVERPLWHTVLDYSGLFLHYFTATLAAGVLIAHAVTALGNRRGVRDMISQVAVLVAAVLAALPLVISELGAHSMPLEIAFAAAVLAIVVAALGRDRDLGIQIGVIVVAVPLLLHTPQALGGSIWWPESELDGAPASPIARAGVMALCAAALVSPYVFAPRPFSRAVTRPGPVIFAMTIAAGGAVAARMYYPEIAHAAKLAIGVKLNQGQADPRLALYLLAIATLSWTLASCAIAAAESRRQIGIGIALVVLGGYAFKWPHHYLLPLLGLALIGDAARRVREEELAALPISTDTPPIQDATWSSFIGAAKTSLGRVLGADVHTLTTRGEGGLATTLIVGSTAGDARLPVRIRVERIEGSVIALDVVVGREIDELRGATLSLWGIPPRALGINPNGPPAAPTFKSGDEMFDARFKCRGSALAFTKLFDDKLRGRVAAALEGWLAYWEGEGLRYRVYPGRGAQLDHPLPLSDLALNRVANPERLVAVVELLVEIAVRGVEAIADSAPSALEEPA